MKAAKITAQVATIVRKRNVWALASWPTVGRLRICAGSIRSQPISPAFDPLDRYCHDRNDPPTRRSLRLVFRLPRRWTRLHDKQMWRTVAAGPVAFGRLHQRPALLRGVPEPDDLAARAVEPVKRVQPSLEQRLAPSKRSHRPFVIFCPDSHGPKNSPRWLKISCKSGARPLVQTRQHLEIARVPRSEQVFAPVALATQL